MIDNKIMKTKSNLILVGAFILLCIVALFFYNKSSDLKSGQINSSEQEVKDLVLSVSKLILLPQNEVPTVATVNDPDKLKDQPFFAKAKVGDKVLLYANAKRAYLYNPTENKIMEIAPINLGDSLLAEPAAKK